MNATIWIRGVLVGASVAAATCVIAPAAPAVADPATGLPCTRENLSWPAGATNLEVLDAEPSGRFQVGWVMDAAGRERIIRWDGGVLEDLGAPHGSVTAINGQGDLIGEVYDDAAVQYTAWRYHNGTYTTLAGLPGDPGSATHAIAADGTVVGVSYSADLDPRPVVWSPDGTVRALPLPAGDDVGVTQDIDVDGTVIGSVGAPWRQVRWAADGTVGEIPAYQPGPNTITSATAISHGVIVGAEEYQQAGVTPQALVWALGAAPASLGGGTADEVNARGSVVLNRLPEAKLWLLHDGTLRSLPTDTTPFPTGRVAGLTDDDAVYGTWNNTPVRWLC